MSLDHLTIIVAAVGAIISVVISKANESQAQKSKMPPFERVFYPLEYCEEATRWYCSVNNKQKEHLDDNDNQQIWEYITNSVSMFLTWAIFHGFACEDRLTDELDAVESVKKREITGTHFFVKYCKGLLFDSHFSEEILPFVNYYFNRTYFKCSRYDKDYDRIIRKKLNKGVPFFPFQWSDYDMIEKSIDKEYKRWERNK